MVIFTIFGVLATAFLALSLYLFITYPKRVYRLVCNAATDAFGFNGRVIIVGTIAHNESRWTELLIKLRSEGLQPNAAAVIAAAWVRDQIPECENQDLMQHIAGTTSLFLREGLQRQLAQKIGYTDSMDFAFTKLDGIMRREGITISD